VKSLIATERNKHGAGTARYALVDEATDFIERMIANAHDALVTTSQLLRAFSVAGKFTVSRNPRSAYDFLDLHQYEPHAFKALLNAAGLDVLLPTNVLAEIHYNRAKPH